MKNLHQLMSDQHLIMSFISDFSREKFTNILNLVKETVSKPDIPILTQKRIYAVSVESLDNILKYVNTTRQGDLPINFKSNLFVITESLDSYEIKTGSYILNHEKNNLQNQIDLVNTLNKEKLQELYKHTLLNSKPQGGGLGIIEMALKTNNKILYEFIYETEIVSLLTICVTLKK